MPYWYRCDDDQEHVLEFGPSARQFLPQSVLREMEEADELEVSSDRRDGCGTAHSETGVDSGTGDDGVADTRQEEYSDVDERSLLFGDRKLEDTSANKAPLDESSHGGDGAILIRDETGMEEDLFGRDK